MYTAPPTLLNKSVGDKFISNKTNPRKFNSDKINSDRPDSADKHHLNKINSGKPDYQGAVLYALGFGLVAALLWFGIVVITKWEIGFVAIAVGYLVGLGVYLGSGKKTGLNLQLISALFSLVAIFIGEYLITNHFIYEFLKSEGLVRLPNGINLSYLLKPILVIEETFFYLKENPLTLLFWAVAIYTGFAVPRNRK